MTTPTVPDAETIAALRDALAPAEVGPVRFRVEAGTNGGALIHVFGAYDCKGTEAEIEGLLKGWPLPWRIEWH